MLRNFHYARTICEALREGLTASHQYEHLRSRSIPHKTALNEALGIGVTPEAQARRVVHFFHNQGPPRRKRSPKQ